MKKHLSLWMVVFCSLCSVAFGKTGSKNDLLKCVGPDRWAASMAQSHLKNAGILKNDEIDFSQTTATLMAMEKKQGRLYHQVQKIVFTKKDGAKIMVIAENDVSHQECSESEVTVYLIDKILVP